MHTGRVPAHIVYRPKSFKRSKEDIKKPDFKAFKEKSDQYSDSNDQICIKRQLSDRTTTIESTGITPTMLHQYVEGSLPIDNKLRNLINNLADQDNLQLTDQDILDLAFVLLKTDSVQSLQNIARDSSNLRNLGKLRQDVLLPDNLLNVALSSQSSEGAISVLARYPFLFQDEREFSSHFLEIVLSAEKPLRIASELNEYSFLWQDNPEILDDSLIEALGVQGGDRKFVQECYLRKYPLLQNGSLETIDLLMDNLYGTACKLYLPKCKERIEQYTKLLESNEFQTHFKDLSPKHMQLILDKHSAVISMKSKEQRLLFASLKKLHSDDNIKNLISLVQNNDLAEIDHILIEDTKSYSYPTRAELSSKIKRFAKEAAVDLDNQLLLPSKIKKMEAAKAKEAQGWKLNGKYSRTASESEQEIILKEKYRYIKASDSAQVIRQKIKANVLDVLPSNYNEMRKEVKNDGKILDTIIEALRQERLNGDKYVFYQGLPRKTAALIQFYSMFRSVLMMDKTETSVAMLRAFDNSFASIPDIEQFIDTMNAQHEKRTDADQYYNYQSGYVDRAVSASENLFANLEDVGDSTLLYFEKSLGLETKLHYDKVIAKVIATLWHVSENDPEVKLRAKQYEELLNKFQEAQGGALFQIFVDSDPEVIDNIAYVSETKGRPLELIVDPSQSRTTHKPSEILPLRRKDPAAFEKMLQANKGQYQDTKVELQRTASAPTQVRIFAKPDVFFSDKVQINQYCSKLSPNETTPEVEKLNQLLSQYAAEDIARSVATKYSFPKDTLVQIDKKSQEGITPLQRYSKYLLGQVVPKLLIYVDDKLTSLQSKRTQLISQLSNLDLANPEAASKAIRNFEKNMNDLDNSESTTTLFKTVTEELPDPPPEHKSTIKNEFKEALHAWKEPTSLAIEALNNASTKEELTLVVNDLISGLNTKEITLMAIRERLIAENTSYEDYNLKPFTHDYGYGYGYEYGGSYQDDMDHDY